MTAPDDRARVEQPARFFTDDDIAQIRAQHRAHLDEQPDPTPRETTAGCGCQYDATGKVFVDHCVCPDQLAPAGDDDGLPSLHLDEVGSVLPAPAGDPKLREAERLRRLLAAEDRELAALREADDLRTQLDERGRELERLRAIKQRACEAHGKAVAAMRQLESWRTVDDERARTVLHAKWGSAKFYRDKLAHILGEEKP